MRYLASVGGRLDAIETSTSETLLHPAARNGDVDLVKYLLAEGLDRDAKTRFGSTALELASNMTAKTKPKSAVKPKSNAKKR